MIPTAGILVLLLYLQLLTDILGYFLSNGGGKQKTTSSGSYQGRERHKNLPTTSPKPIRTLDGLWKRMMQAREQDLQQSGLKPDEVTKKMSEARAELRRLMSARMAAARATEEAND
ncbi:uncharacterized protein LOC135501744 [Lineus longissimus]|uniref:uncharacterized protein LOC135501744 n=1 Tax=Lineus longissimus TaxID=88925 RepID=UPI00315CC325